MLDNNAVLHVIKNLLTPHYREFVIELKVGICTRNRVIFLHSIAIEKEYRNLGIGSNIIKTLMAVAEVNNMFFFLYPANTNAKTHRRLVRYYKRLGLEVVEEFKNSFRLQKDYPNRERLTSLPIPYIRPQIPIYPIYELTGEK